MQVNLAIGASQPPQPMADVRPSSFGGFFVPKISVVRFLRTMLARLQGDHAHVQGVSQKGMVAQPLVGCEPLESERFAVVHAPVAVNATNGAHA